MTSRGDQRGNGAGRSRAAPAEALELALTQLGRRHSRQREAIARTFFGMGGHVPVEALVARVREADPRVSVATVYRTMKLLASSGLAVSRDFGDGRVRYERAAARRDRDHDHLVCTSCGAIVEFESHRVEVLQRRLARRHGFEVERRHVELYGRCLRCRGQDGARTA
jgi:Fur family ferric uptake transcriptional regulator